MTAPHIALIVTGDEAFNDFQVFVKTLEVWHPDAALYIYTDSPTAAKISGLRCKPTLHLRTAMDAYVGLNRAMMEASAGRKYASLFTDYTYEKAEALRWVLGGEEAAAGVWFMDADIVHCAPLPSIPTTAEIALSPHMIRAADERMFGKYNAGFFWIKNAALIDVWCAAAPRSRFFEQAPLEEVAAAAAGALHEFPVQVNFGWWRMYQGIEPPHAIQAKFGFNRADRSIGLRFQGAPIQSFHSHMFDRGTGANGAFNKWLDGATAKFAAAHAPLRGWRRTVGF